MNGTRLNGVEMSGTRLNGRALNGIAMNGPHQPVGFNFNALKLHAVVLPTDAQ
jgi:hypothetical protein